MDTAASFILSIRADGPPAGQPASAPPTVSVDKKLSAYYTAEYPKEIWYLLAIVIGTISLLQFLSFLHSKYARRSSPTVVDAERNNGPTRHAPFVRRLPLALLNEYRIVAFRSTVHFGGSYSLNVAEVIVTIGYMSALFLWEFMNTTNSKGVMLDPSYWANRAGTIAVSQFPLITALGTKNNVLTVITGISYDKLNYVHRMAAHVTMVLVWVHAGAKIQQGISEDLGESFIQMGLIAASTLGLLVLLSVRPIRTKAYEFFYYMHFALVLTFLVAAYFHTKMFKYDPYIWSCYIIWGLDRVLRVGRLVYNNYQYFTLTDSSSLDAQTELVADKFVRLTVRRPPHVHWKAGQTAYLVVPGISTLPFESHPFTIGSLETPPECRLQSSSSLSIDALKQQGMFGLAADWNEMTFLINVREGFTKRLGEVAAHNAKVKVLVDGPYGPAPDLGCFNTSVLIAGGSGVTYTLPVFLDTVERVRNGLSDCRRLVFIWAIKDADHVRWISDTVSRMLQTAPSWLDIVIRIHVTKGSSLQEPSRGYTEKVHDGSSVHSGSETVHALYEQETGRPGLLLWPQVRMLEHRPDFESILEGEVEATNGRMVVSVCGSQGVAESVRCALRSDAAGMHKVLTGGASVTLHVESFGYA